MLPSLLAALAMTLSPPLPTPPPGFQEADYQAWVEKRETGLRKPDSWLSLVGLVWLEQGTFTVGSGADAHYQLNTGPATLGTLWLAHDGQVWFKLAPQAGEVTLDGVVLAPESKARLTTDAEGATPSKIGFGDAHFIVIERSGKVALRVKDASATTLTSFTGNVRYPFSVDWVVSARWEAFAEPEMLEIASVIGTVDQTPSPGKAHFAINGKEYTLQPTLEGDQLFFVFGDRTNGKETYGMARYLYGKVEADGKTVVIDFNRAYNPPCVYTPYATCPLPIPANRLDLFVTAGEKTYAGPGAH
jgi:uncharacterized protein